MNQARSSGLSSRASAAPAVPATQTEFQLWVARIQEMHILLGQMLCGALEIELGLVGERA